MASSATVLKVGTWTAVARGVKGTPSTLAASSLAAAERASCSLLKLIEPRRPAESRVRRYHERRGTHLPAFPSAASLRRGVGATPFVGEQRKCLSITTLAFTRSSS